MRDACLGVRRADFGRTSEEDDRAGSSLNSSGERERGEGLIDRGGGQGNMSSGMGVVCSSWSWSNSRPLASSEKEEVEEEAIGRPGGVDGASMGRIG